MKHKTIVNKVCNWFKDDIPNCEIKKEVRYKINLPRKGLNKQFFRADIIVNNKITNQQIGVECKTLNDSNNFRKLMAGVGQTYILQSVFGLSYLAIEIEADMLSDNFKFYKRQVILENIYRELSIGILVVNSKVRLVRKSKFVKPSAKTLFTTLERRRSK